MGLYLLLQKVTAHSPSAVPEIQSLGGNDEHIAPLEERRMDDCDFGCDGYDAEMSDLDAQILQIQQEMTDTGNVIIKRSTNRDNLDPDNEWVDKEIALYQKQLRKLAQQLMITANRLRFAQKQKGRCKRREAKCERKKAKAARRAAKNKN